MRNGEYMRPKQKLAALFTVLLILQNTFPVFAVSKESSKTPETSTIIQVSGSTLDAADRSNESINGLLPSMPFLKTDVRDEITVFTAELRKDGESPGLYGTLNYIPEDTKGIWLQYSLDGANFYESNEFPAWDMTKPAGQPQLLMENGNAPLRAYLEESVNTLFVRMIIQRNSTAIETQSVVFTHGKTWTSPETPPPFSAWIEDTGGGYHVIGKFSDFTPDVVGVRPLYSLDEENYQPIKSSYEDFFNWDLKFFERNGEITRDEEQYCMSGQVEPLKSYMDGTLTKFYLKLEITKENGETYYTQVVKLDRNETILVPEDAEVRVRYASNMRTSGRPAYGKYQLTVAEGTTWAQVQALLPRTIDMEVQIFLPNTNGVPMVGTIKGELEWKLPDTLADGELKDAAIVRIPPNQKVETSVGVFQLTGAPKFNMELAESKLHLVPNLVPKEAEPTGVLMDNYNRHLDCDVLEMAFNLKPTGATAIHAYTFVEGNDKWLELPDVPLQESVNSQPRWASTDYVTLLCEDQGVYQAWRNGELERFWIGITIEGGVYDGKSMVLAWPEEYKLPPNAPDVNGAGGNENNAGNENGSNDNDGQRPLLPPAITPDPPKTPNVPPTTTTEPPKSLDNGNGLEPSIVPDLLKPTEVPVAGTTQIDGSNRPDTTSKETTDESSPNSDSTQIGQPVVRQEERNPVQSKGLSPLAKSLLMVGGILGIAVIGTMTLNGKNGVSIFRKLSSALKKRTRK